MKYLLVAVNAKYIHSNPAIYLIKQYSNCNNVEICEYTINNSTHEILRDIILRKPKIVAFSCYIWNITIIKELAKSISIINPDIDIFLGGPEVSYNPSEIIKELPFIKGIMIGEGEKTFSEIIYKYDNKIYDFSDIDGLFTHPKNITHFTTIDINSLPFIYADGFDNFENRIIYYESTRGCPYRCSYCLSSIDKTIRTRDINKVKEEIKFFLDNNIMQVKFIDRTFNFDKERALEIWNFIYDNDNGITNFHFEIAADIINNDEIVLLQKMRPGLIQLEIGVQTTNPDTLKAINRQSNINKIRDVIEKLNHNHNIHIHLDLIAGLPYEDFESFKKSFNDVFNMHPCQLQLGFLKVLKGTQIFKQAEKFGIKYTLMPPFEVLKTNWLTYENICTLKDVEEMVEIYYNSSQYTTVLPILLNYYNEPFDLFEALANFYRENNFFNIKPPRHKKYEILLQFITSKTNLDINIIKDALILDFYLREKPKNKPSFGGNLPTDIKFDYVHRDPLTGNYLIVK